MTAAELSVDNVRKTYGPTVALDEVTLTVPAGSLTALVGPSGCGKSTLLSVVAGLLEPDHGGVRLGGTSLDAVPAERRPVSLVFQKPLLFPHLSVADNVAFGLRMRGVPKRARQAAVEQALASVRLDGLAGRRVGELSGGQEQRAALARAVVLDPQLLLLDEPFSQLDAALRREMRSLVRTLHGDRGLTTLFVTHDQAEAVEVADEIVLLLDGRVAGQGPPELFYRRPPSLAAARFFGVGNEVAGEVHAGRFTAPALEVATTAPDGPAVLVVRPEALRLGEAGGAGPAGRVTAARFAGTYVACTVAIPTAALEVHVPADRPVTVGASVTVDVPEAACTVFATERG